VSTAVKAEPVDPVPHDTEWGPPILHGSPRSTPIILY
jgi:hypothetical protein